MEISKEMLGLAGEFAVASELCRRGIYAQLTLGNRKSTDLLVDSEDGGMARVQVKSKQGREWPACKGVACGKQNVLVFVDLQNKAHDERPDFYILTGEDWKEIVNAGLLQEDDSQIINGYIFTYKDGFTGLNVTPKMVQQYLEKWDTIKSLLSSQNRVLVAGGA